VCFVAQHAEESSKYKEKKRQLTSTAVDINFACDVLFENFVMVALEPINSSQIYEKTQRYETYFTDSFFAGYSIVLGDRTISYRTVEIKLLSSMK